MAAPVDSPEAQPPATMTSTGCSGIESSERAREREIAAYLSAASFPPGLKLGFQATPFINTDATLNALTQLGALRLNCDRAFISLIDRRYQFVVTEITRTHSFVNIKSAPGDTVAIGVCKIRNCDGVCPATMKAFMDETGEWIKTGPDVISNRTRYIINNFKTHPDYKDRPYVLNYPFFTSYLEVPLVSPLGYLLGSYCVVDSKPNDFDHDDIVETMNEIASAIMAHLENVRIRQSRDRSEQLIQGLSGFIRHEPPLQTSYPSRDTGPGRREGMERPVNRPRATTGFATNVSTSSASGKQNQSTHTPSSDGSQRPPPLNLGSSSSIESSQQAVSLSSNPNQDNDSETPPTSPRDDQSSNIMEQQLTTAIAQANTGAASPLSSSAPRSDIQEPPGFISSANIKTTFFQAAATIRRSMDMNGLMFLDAVPSSYVDRPDQPSMDSSHDPVEGPFCSAIVKSSLDAGGETVSHSAQTQLPEVSLQRFIRAYPNGHVFTADELGPIDDSYGVGKRYKSHRKVDRYSLQLQKDIDALFRVLPAAKYVIFLPLWHFQRECWYAAVLGWIEDPTRAVGVADLGLVSAFGNSVMAEVSRLEALAASRAKSDFVSSLSHELRSPLHGIMASSELLRDAITDRSLLSTLDMLDSCATTLLDTFNNLLDHAIVTHAGAAESSPISELRTADLGALVEDVVEAVRVGQLSGEVLGMQTQVTHRRGTCSTDLARAGHNRMDRPLLITVHIAKHQWNLPINVGAWKRIIMNTFSNAFKYTRAGRIEVRLKMERRTDNRTGKAAEYIAFSVDDTGLGMSSDYLKYRLFTPFAQEDTHAPGMGLGLSIVQQLVRELDGLVNVKSSLGVGTQVEVLVPFSKSAPGSPTTPEHPGAIQRHQPLNDNESLFRGRTLCLITPEACAAMADTDIEITKDLRDWSANVERSVEMNAGGFLGLKVFVGTKKCPAPKADVYLLDCNFLGENAKPIRDTILRTWLPQITPLVYLCSGSGGSSCLKQQMQKGHGIHLHPPIGPRKLASVLRSALEGKVDAHVAQTLPGGQLEDLTHKLPDTSTAQSQQPPQASTLPPLTIPTHIKPPISSPPTSIPSPPENTTNTPPQNLPVFSPPPILTDLPAPQTTTPPLNQKPYHLLLVDDNPVNLKILTHLVQQKLSHTCATAANGLEAVQVFKHSLSLPEKQQDLDEKQQQQQNPDQPAQPQQAATAPKKFDMVLMDISMPVMNGFG
ncbi:hypothetical protein N0V88_006283 [Collariella sp. IMI 366227]|nr:hypothetical protein N0V88_006283 [Collariella sp. IMI 366227]